MTPPKTRTRAAAATATVLALLAWGSVSTAAAAAPTATVGAVACAEQQGSFDITLTAGDAATGFGISVEDSFAGETLLDYRDVPAGGTETVPVSGLTDDDYTVTVESSVGGAAESLVTVQRAVSCDPAPEGPYSNPRGALNDSCSADIEVRASNRPIGGNTADLQPVTFTVTYQPSEDPGAGDPVTVDTFTLDATTPTFRKTYQPDADDYFFGTVRLTAGGTEIATADVGVCVGEPTTGGGSGSGSDSDTLPNTGA